MKSDIHIIICFNPMVNIYINDLIREKNVTEYLVIEFYSKHIISNVDKDKVKRYTYSGNIDYIRKLKACIRFVSGRIKGFKKVNFYFSHPFHMLSNYFFFSDNPKYHFFQIPDGIANYYEVTTRDFITKMIAKKIVSILTFAKYSMYRGHLTGIHTNRFDSIITLHKKGLKTNGLPVEVIKLSRSESIKTPAGEKILILGQTYKNYTYYKDSYQKIFNYIQDHFPNQSNIFYKKHPNETINQDFKKLLDTYSIKTEKNENQVETFGFNYHTIISEASSALFNLKILFGNTVNCIAYLKNIKYLSGRVIKNEHVLEIKQRLENVGVTVIE